MRIITALSLSLALFVTLTLTRPNAEARTPHSASASAPAGKHASGKKPTGTTPEKSLRFLVLGDWGNNGQLEQQHVADAMGRYNEEFGGKFVISTGDNFYCCGVASPEDPQWMSSYENVYTNHSLQIDWYPVLGNHDYLGNPQAEIDYSKRSRRWVMPARYHTVVRKIGKAQSVRLIFLDTDPFIESYLKNADAYDHLQAAWADQELVWLDSVLSASTEQWKIVVGHHPVYSSGSEHGDQKELIARLEPVLEKYQVDAYFSGHEHDLQHQKRKDGTVNYFVSGSAGAPRPTGRTATTLFSSADPGFMAVTLTTSELTVEAINKAGKRLYTTTLAK